MGFKALAQVTGEGLTNVGFRLMDGEPGSSGPLERLRRLLSNTASSSLLLAALLPPLKVTPGLPAKH